MIIIKVKNVGIFLAIFTLILGINLGLGFQFSVISWRFTVINLQL